MRGGMKWLLVPAGLALVLFFAAVQSADAQVVTVHYGPYGYYSGCYVPHASYYPSYYPAPVVPYYRAPVVLPRPVFRYYPYRAYYAPVPWRYYGYRVW